MSLEEYYDDYDDLREKVNKEKDNYIINQQPALIFDTRNYMPDLDDLYQIKYIRDIHTKVIGHVYNTAKTASDMAYLNLVKKVNILGFHIKDLESVIEYIRDVVPIIIHISINKLNNLIGDTHYRSCFEFDSVDSMRIQVENNLFNNIYNNCKPVDRCKYATMNMFNADEGVISARNYGECYMTLKRGIRIRTSYTVADSYGTSTIASCEFYNHILLTMPEGQLKDLLKFVTLGIISVTNYPYQEAQIHGDIILSENIHSLTVPMNLAHSGVVPELIQKNGWILRTY